MVIQAVMDIKLSRETTGTCKFFLPIANQVGKQGIKCPLQDTNDMNKSFKKTDPLILDYLYKPSDLMYAEVNLLLKRYSCLLCRCNNYALYKCGTFKNYNISLKVDTIISTSSTNTTSGTALSTANQINPLPQDAPAPECHDDFESILQSPMQAMQLIK